MMYEQMKNTNNSKKIMEFALAKQGLHSYTLCFSMRLCGNSFYVLQEIAIIHNFYYRRVSCYRTKSLIMKTLLRRGRGIPFMEKLILNVLYLIVPDGTNFIIPYVNHSPQRGISYHSYSSFFHRIF